MEKSGAAVAGSASSSTSDRSVCVSCDADELSGKAARDVGSCCEESPAAPDTACTCSVWPTLADGKPSPHDAILINTTPNAGAVRAGDWKLVVNNGPDDPDGGVPKKKKKAAKSGVELFNLKDDPYEKANLADKHPDRVKELSAKYDAWAKRVNVAPWPLTPSKKK